MQLPLAQIIPTTAPPLSTHTIDAAHGLIASACPRSSASAARPAHAQACLYSLHPFSRSSAPLRYQGDRALSLVHPLGTSNLVLLVPKHTKSKGKVVLWDDKAEASVLELGFSEPVLGLACRADKLVVALRRRAVLFHFDVGNRDVAKIFVKEGEYETADNPFGLISISTLPGSSLLALPGRQPGHVQLVELPPLASTSTQRRPGVSSPASKTPPYPIVHILVAHTSPLRTLSLSRSGSLLATSSTKGTLLRVYSTAPPGRSLLRELRRGTDQADIWSVAFADQAKGEIIACSSDKGTVHIWHIGDLSASAHAQAPAVHSVRARVPSLKTKETSLNLLKPYLPAYFSSQWSDLTWRIPTATSLASNEQQDDEDTAQCVFVQSSAEVKAGRPDLLVITRSGGWFRLSTSLPQDLDQSKAKGKESTSVKTGGSLGKKQESEREDKHAVLLEHRRFGPQPDGEEDWSDEDD